MMNLGPVMPFQRKLPSPPVFARSVANHLDRDLWVERPAASLTMMGRELLRTIEKHGEAQNQRLAEEAGFLRRLTGGIYSRGVEPGDLVPNSPLWRMDLAKFETAFETLADAGFLLKRSFSNQYDINPAKKHLWK